MVVATIPGRTPVPTLLDRADEAIEWTRLNVRYWLPAQLVDATQALNLSAGLSNPKVLRGRSLSWRATLLR